MSVIPWKIIGVTLCFLGMGMKDGFCGGCFSRHSCELDTELLATRQNTTTRRTVVFDIDETTFHSVDNPDPNHLSLYNELFLTSPIFGFRDKKFHLYEDSNTDLTNLHFPVLHLDIVLRYLWSKGVKIDYFSFGAKERNVPLIRAYYDWIRRENKLPSLAEEPVTVLSREHLTFTPWCCCLYAHKDIEHHGYDLEHTIQVDDSYSVIHWDQGPHLPVYSMNFHAFMTRISAVRNGTASDDDSDFIHFITNQSFYMIGLFDWVMSKKGPIKGSLRACLNTYEPELSQFFSRKKQWNKLSKEFKMWLNMLMDLGVKKAQEIDKTVRKIKIASMH